MVDKWAGKQREEVTHPSVHLMEENENGLLVADDQHGILWQIHRKNGQMKSRKERFVKKLKKM